MFFLTGTICAAKRFEVLMSTDFYVYIGLRDMESFFAFLALNSELGTLLLNNL